MNIFKQTIVVSTTLLLGACSSIEPFTEGELVSYERGSCLFHNDKEVMPDWLCAPTEMFPINHVYSSGTANSSINDYDTQMVIAMENAKAALVTKVVSENRRDYEEGRNGTGQLDSQHFEIYNKILTKNYSTLTLPPVSKVKQHYDSKGNFYVLIKVDRQALNKKIKEKEDRAKREFEKQLKS